MRNKKKLFKNKRVQYFFLNKLDIDLQYSNIRIGRSPNGYWRIIPVPHYIEDELFNILKEEKFIGEKVRSIQLNVIKTRYNKRYSIEIIEYSGNRSYTNRFVIKREDIEEWKSNLLSS